MPLDDDGEYIYTRRIRLRNGRVIFAHTYGLQAFRIRVRPGRRPN